jgi:AcrR family transcriptional regulator
MAGPTAPAVDRRRLRAERGREAVVDALLSFYNEGEHDPGAAAIAQRAGVSERSVFRYFQDLEALADAAVQRHWERVGNAFDPPPAVGDLRARATALVEQRFRIHQIAGPVARAGELLARRSETVARGLDTRRRMLRSQLGPLFPEIEAQTGRAERAELLAALDAATSVEQVEYLRTGAGLSAPRARAVMLRTVLALLEPIDRADGASS